MKLLSIKSSPRSDKKWVAEFDDGTKTHFGAVGYGDYTTTGDKDKRSAYRSRLLELLHSMGRPPG